MPDKTKMKRRAQELRREMTAEERHLYYDYFKHLSVTVKRQRPFGYYIADFYIAKANLIVELDGAQHYEADGKAWDLERDRFFTEQGILVLRYTNADINQRFRAVCEDITLHIEKRSGERMTYK